MFENFENDKLEMIELSEVRGGNGALWQLVKEVAKSAVVGELITATKNAVGAAIGGYMDECAKGTYVGIPRGR